MARAAYRVCACFALCAVVVVWAFERAFEFVLGVLDPRPPRIVFGGDLQPTPAFATFADPHVDRHEAGMSRRAALRGI